MFAAIVLLLLVQFGFGLFSAGLYGLAFWLTLFFVAFNILEATQPSLISRIAPPHAKGAALGVYNTTQALGLFLGGVERSKIICKLADLIEANAEKLAKVESENTGKPYEFVSLGGDIPFAVDNLRFFASAARATHGSHAGEYMTGYTYIYRREPVGVVGQIAPWNYPVMMAAWKIGPALAAGCTIVLKPAPARRSPR